MARKRPNRRLDESKPLMESIAFKLSTKLALGLVVILVFLTIAQCTVKKPESPSWNSKVIIPMINRTYTMPEIINKIDQEGLALDSLGDVNFSFSEELDTVSLDPADFTTSDISHAVSDVLGPITIAAPNGTNQRTNFTQIQQLNGLITGADAIVSLPVGFSLSTNHTMTNTFTAAAIQSGSANVTFYNNLGLTLDTLRITLTDLSYGFIANATYATPILSGDTVTFPIDLANTNVSYQWNIAAFCHTPGGVATSIATRYLDFSIDFPSDFVVNAATAQIPSVSPMLFSEQIALVESDRIDTAYLTSGNLDLSVVNHTNLDADLTITIPDLISGGLPLVVNQPVAGGISVPQLVSIDLSSYQIAPSDLTVPQLLDLDVVATIAGSGTNQVQVSAIDSIGVTASLTGMAFSKVTGVFSNLGASFDNISEAIDVPTGFDDVELQRAYLQLEIHSAVDLPGNINITLLGDQGQTLNLVGQIAAAGDSVAITYLEVADSANFLAPIPSQIDISGSVDFGDGVYLGSIENNDFVSATVTVSAPLEMVIPSTLVSTDITSEEIDQSDIEVITDHFIEGVFSYNVTNRLPMGAQVRLFFSSDSATLFTAPQLLLPKPGADSIHIPMAPVGVGGVTTDTVSSGWVNVGLDSTDIKILNNTVLYMGQELILDDSQGQVVRLHQSDYLNIKGRIEVEYLFDGDF